MAESEATYVAWDGVLYEGSPPIGWYLAADNRWWPPQEVIETGVPIDEYPLDDPYPDEDPYLDEDPLGADPYDAATGYNPSDPGGNYDSGYEPGDGYDPGNQTTAGLGSDRRSDPPPPLPDEWAPRTGSETGHRESRPAPPAGPARGLRTRQTGKTRSKRRRGGFPIGFLIPLLFFGFARCNATFDNDAPPVDFDFGEDIPEQYEWTEPTAGDGFAIGVEGDSVAIGGPSPLLFDLQACGPDVIEFFLMDQVGDGDYVVELLFQPVGPVTREPFGNPLLVVREGQFGLVDGRNEAHAVPDEWGEIEDCELIEATLIRP